MARIQSYVNEMLAASKVDMEKILIAKGFRTLGPFDTIDEMTFSQKSDATLIYAPEFDAKLDFVAADTQIGGSGRVAQTGQVVIRGSEVLTFLEPLTREKVWLKRYDLEQFSAPYDVNARVGGQSVGTLVADAITGQNVQPTDTRASAAVTVLNSFYAAAMQKMWDHLDPREIDGLTAEAGRLKKLKRF